MRSQHAQLIAMVGKVGPNLKYLIFGGLLLVINVAHSIFIELSANPDGSLPYSASTASFLVEAWKLIFAFFVYIRLRKDDTDAKHHNVTWGVLCRMAVPASLYTLVNILSFFAIGYLGSTKYQMFANIKIFATAFAFRIAALKRSNVLHWFFIALLIAGLLVGTPQSSTSAQNLGENVALGIVLVTVISLCSAFAGVYFELQLKTATEHPVLQNLLLYCWTSLLCFILHITRVDARSSDGYVGSFFEEHMIYAWGGIITSAIYGQVVALTLYFCDNMVKVFASSSAVFASAIVDRFLFRKEMSFNVYLGGLIVSMATIGYYCRHDTLLEEDVVFMKRQNLWLLMLVLCFFLVFSVLLLSDGSPRVAVDTIERGILHPNRTVISN